MKRTLSGLLLLVTVTVLWFTVGQGKPIPLVSISADRQVTQSYLEHAERWSYDTDGFRDQRVRLESGISYTDSPTTFLQGLTFEGPDHNGRYWHIAAGAGILKADGRELQLTQGVEIRESNGEGVLTTPSLRILPKENKAMNSAPVTLLLRNSVTTARGLEVDLNTGVARLLQDVETVYEG